MSVTCAADMHTHLPGHGDFALVSCRDSGLSGYTSKEFHPWYLPEKFETLGADFSEELKKFNALGEIGLDRLRGPDLTIQRRYFEALLEVADALHKPVVIHNVRCEAEIFSALKGFSSPVLFHGFCGGVRTAEKILDAGYFLSFNRISNASVKDFLLSRGLANVGIESDESGMNIEDISDEISRILDMDMRTASFETFRKFLAL